jgi:drug/metabolite transporter (DMT)-like permease
MEAPFHLLYPLASSLGYVLGVLLLKRSAAFGIGVWRTTFVANAATILCFMPLWLLEPGAAAGGHWWQPVITSLLFFLGQIFTFLAIRGDVSVATPVLGLKIILVALFSSALLPEGVPLHWWAGALLSTLGIAVLNRGSSNSGQSVARTVVMAAAAATAFALSDVLVQKWTLLWGAGRFLPLMFALVMIYSVALVPAFQAPLRTISRDGWRWLLPGAFVLALQAIGMAWAIGVHGDATAVNIVYSLRGLWSVLAVWWIGHWFSNEEQRLGAGVLRGRLVGAALMLAAIALVIWPL